MEQIRPAPAGNFRRNLLIATVIVAAIMELIDTSIVNVALSVISGNLGASLEDTSWVITSYAIANVIVIPITSFLAARLGRRNYYIGSVILFTFFSFMCGQAGSVWELVVYRFLQGVGGGALLSVSQAIVFELFPKEKHGVAGAIFGIGVFTGPTIGPTLGGLITENYSWPWIFYINVPIGIAVVISCWFLLAEPKVRAAAGRIDWAGIALLAVGVGSLQTVLERGEAEDWFDTRYILFLSVIAVFALALFVWWELRIKAPVVDLRVLKSRSLSIAAILTFVSGIGLFTSVFLTPVLAQRLLGFTPTQTGLLLLPGAVLAVFGLMVSARMLQRGVSPLLVITLGFVLFIVFAWQMAQLNPAAGSGDMYGPLIFRALGMALVTVPLTTLAVSSLAPKDIPQGTALNNMMRQLGGSFGIALVNTYLVNRSAVHRADLVSHLTVFDTGVTARLQQYTAFFVSKGYALKDAEQNAFRALNATVTKHASFLSFIDAYLLIGVIFLCSAPLVLVAISRKKKKVVPVLAE